MDRRVLNLAILFLTTVPVARASKPYGQAVVWGNQLFGAHVPPQDSANLQSGVERVYSNDGAFVAVKQDSSTVVWGAAVHGGTPIGALTGIEAVYSNNVAFAALGTDGSLRVWGLASRGGNAVTVEPALSSGVTAVFSTKHAFAALKNDTSLVIWGEYGSGGLGTTVEAALASGVSTVFSAKKAFAALKQDGSIVSWGDNDEGGALGGSKNALTANVSSVTSTNSAFAALKLDGSVVAWGATSYGGDLTTVSNELTTGVTAIYASGGAFAALKGGGAVVTWGGAEFGGDSKTVEALLASSVTKVYATISDNGGAFAALKADGTLVTWGAQLHGGHSRTVENALASGAVSHVTASESAFAAVMTDGSVAVWGSAAYGGSPSTVQAALASNVVNISSTLTAFAALKSDGSVVAWSLHAAAGSMRTVEADLASGVTAIQSNEAAFVAFKNDTGVVVWGFVGYGGNALTVMSSLSSGVTAVVPAGKAFAAIKSDGTVVCWGAGNVGGFAHQSLPPALKSGVKTVYSTPYAFAAVKNDSVVSWGDARHGGNSETVSTLLSGNVSRVFSSTYAFAALMNDSSLVVWGGTGGGDSSTVQALLNSNVSAVSSSVSAFAALRTDGRVVTWGDDSLGGESVTVADSLSSGVSSVTAGFVAFAALKNGGVVCWGDNRDGGNMTTVASVVSANVTTVISSKRAFAALKSDGSVHAWGLDEYGGSTATVEAELAGGVRKVFSSPYAFAALKDDGKLVTWGKASNGGDSSTVKALLQSGVVAVHSNIYAFVAVRNDSSAVAWGSEGGGNAKTVASELASGVLNIYSTSGAFAAEKSDRYVTWGFSANGGNSATVASALAEYTRTVVGGVAAFVAIRTAATNSPTTSPTTGAPTTLSPTTLVPTTQSPVTGAPSSHSPITQSPATASPTMEGPTAVSAILSDSVTSIRIRVSRPVDPLVPSDCASLFSSPSLLELGASPVCVWADPNSLDVSLGPGFAATPGGALTIADGVLFSPGETRRTPAHAVLVAGPLNSPAVAVSVAVPTTIGACDLFVESTATASGSAGKPLNYTWRFDRSDPPATADFQNRMDVYLGRPTHGSRVIFSGSNFSLNTQYWFNLTATNWLGTAATTTFSFSKIGKAQPTLALPSATAISAKRAESLEIRVQVHPPQCPGFNVPTLITRGLWTQVQGPSVPIPDPSSVYLYVPSNSLEADTTYRFQIYVWTVDAASQLVGNVTEIFTVAVQKEPIVASIAGGSSRAVSVVSSQWLTFDASASYDPMYGDISVNFTWSVFPGPIALNNSLTSMVNGSKLSFSKSLLAANRSYIISVVVYGARGRTASAAQVVVTSAVPVPRVAITTSNTRAKHNPGQKLVLTASVGASNASVAALLWSCESQNFNTSDRSLLRSGLTSYNLVLAPNALLAGLAYEFRFTVTSSYGGVGYASAIVNVNAPPTLGSCKATPAAGTALETQFRLGCSGWTDNDVPLLYKFQVASTRLDVCDFRQLEFYDTLLPAGSSQFRAVIVDSYGGTAHSIFNVSVSQPAELDLSSAERERNERLAEGDTQAFAVLCAGTATYLKTSDSVNASTATSARKNILASIRDLRNASTAPVDGLVASLVESVTDYDDESEIADPENQAQAIELLQSVSSSSSTLSGDAIVASTTAVTNLVSAAATSSDARSAVNSSTLIESVLVQLSNKLLEDTVPGEDQQTAQTREGVDRPVSIEISGRVASAASTGSSILSSAVTDTAVAFPPIPENLATTADVRLSAIAVQGDALYPRNASVADSDQSFIQGGLVSIHVRNSTGESLSVQTNGTHPFTFMVPRGVQTQVPETYKVEGFVCEYWNADSDAWRRDGVRAFNLSSGKVHCNSTHLTAFSSRTEFRVRVNTFSGRDISLGAFDPNSNPMMALVIAVLAAFLALYPLAWTHDRRMKRLDSDGCRELAFWRAINRMHHERVNEPRAVHRFVDLARWALRRRHPWASLFFRPSGDYLTSRKRLMILLVLLLNMACVCTLLVGNDQALPFVQGPVANALVACMLAFPLPYIFAKLFSRKMPTKLRIKRDSAMMSGGCVGLVMMILTICVGLDLGNDEGDDQDGDDVENAEGEEKNDAGDEKEDDEDIKAARQSRIVDQDDEKDGKSFHARSDLQLIAGGAAGGGAIGGGAALRRAPNARESKSARSRLMEDVRQLRKGSPSEVEMLTLEEGKRTRRVTRRYSSCFQSGPAPTTASQSSAAPASAKPLGISIGGQTAHEWTKLDVFALVCLVVVTVGCVFILGMLSWTHPQSVSRAVQTSVASFGQDIFARAVLIVFTEYVLAAPVFFCCCCCLYSFQSEGARRAELQSSSASRYRFVELHGDREGFEFDRAARVTKVFRQARVRGVRLGMRIVAVNGDSVHDGRQVRDALARAHRLHEWYSVTVTDSTGRRGSATAPAGDDKALQSPHVDRSAGSIGASSPRSTLTSPQIQSAGPIAQDATPIIQKSAARNSPDATPQGSQLLFRSDSILL